MNTTVVGRQRGRKAVTENHRAQAVLCPQDAIWTAIRTLRNFSRADLCCQLARQGLSGINDHTVKSYLTRLRRGGYIELANKTPCRGIAVRYDYTLVRDVGRDAPRLGKSGEPTRQGLGTEQMWRTMKIIGDFSYIDLVAAASIDACPIAPASAKRYIGHLHTAGYLACVKPGKAHVAARYRLLPSKNTGPKAPMIQRIHRVFDPNLKRIVSEGDT